MWTSQTPQEETTSAIAILVLGKQAAPGSLKGEEIAKRERAMRALKSLAELVF
jgi:hypothetical protein